MNLLAKKLLIGQRQPSKNEQRPLLVLIGWKQDGRKIIPSFTIQTDCLSEVSDLIYATLGFCKVLLNAWRDGGVVSILDLAGR